MHSMNRIREGAYSILRPNPLSLITKQSQANYYASRCDLSYHSLGAYEVFSGRVVTKHVKSTGFDIVSCDNSLFGWVLANDDMASDTAGGELIECQRSAFCILSFRLANEIVRC